MPSFPTLSPEDRALVEGILDRFRAAWTQLRPGQPAPRIDEFVRTGPPGLLDMLRHELEEIDRPLREEHRHQQTASVPPGSAASDQTTDDQATGDDLGATVESNMTTDDAAAGRTTDHDVPARPNLDGWPDIPGYEIVGELGRGGMGVVYKAKQLRANRLVALKMLLAAQASEAQKARFATEAESVARLQHPNIVQVFEVGEHDGRAFFSLEFVEGGTLQKKTTRDLMPPREAARLLLALCRAIQYAHDHNVIHRDLKPANVLLTTDDRPKIADFGLARKLEESGTTMEGSILGTPSYMSPEQARGEIEAVGPAADQYALGAILYEMLTGRPPFKGSTMLDTLQQVRNNDPVAIRTLQPKAPKDLETIALKCLRKEPKRRYASVKELGDDLERYLNNEPIKARPVSVYGRAWSWCKRNPIVAGLLTTAFLLLATIASVSTYSYFRVATAERRAMSELSRATGQIEALRGGIDTFGIGMPGVLDNIPFSAQARRDLAGLLLTMLDEDGPARLADPNIMLRGKVAAHLQKGDALLLEATPEKLDAAEAAYQQAYELAQQEYQESSERDKSAGNLALISLKLATVARARAAATRKPDEKAKHLAAARKHLDEALKRQQQVVDSPNPREIRPAEAKTTLAVFHTEMALVAYTQSDIEAAHRHASAADALLTELRAPGVSPDYLHERQRKSAQMAALERGRIAYTLKKIDEGKDAFTRSVRLGQEIVKVQPNNLRGRQNLAVAAAELGDNLFYHHGNDAVEASKYYQIALEQTRHLATPPELVSFVDLGHALNFYRCGAAAQKAGDAESARKHFNRCLELRQWYISILQDDPTSLKDGRFLRARINLMLALARCGKHTESAAIAGNLLKAGRAKMVTPSQMVEGAFAFGLCRAVASESKLQQQYKENAIELLTLAVKGGYRNAPKLRTDPDGDPIRDLPEFQALLKQVEKK